MMDKPAIHAVEEFVHAGYPLDVEALLIVEVDGPPAEVDRSDRAHRDRSPANATRCRARPRPRKQQRLLFWAGRKAAFPAVGRISPDYYCMDGTIPRAKLPLVLARTRELSEKYGLRVANVFHAGDGNLHPLILYDSNKPGELDRAEQFGAEILKLCVEVGGVLTGEHGVGVEKRDLMPVMFSEIDLNAAAARQMRLRRQGPAQSRQGVPGAAPLRRTGPHAHFRRQAAVPGYSEVLSSCVSVCSVRPKPIAPLGPETGQGFRDYLDFNVEAEALGFHSSFSVEHHFTGWNQVSATLMLLMALAMRTKTLRLGTAVMVLPWHNPVLLAEQAATLDLVSDGRLRFRHRQGLPAQRIQGLPDRAGGGRSALRGSDRSDDARLDHAHALLASRPLLAFRGHRGRAAAGAKPASAVLGRRRQSAFDQARRRARLQSDPRSICLARNARRAHRDLQGRARGARARLRSDAGDGRAPALCRQGQGRQGRRRSSARPNTPSAPSMSSRTPGAKARQRRLARAGLCRQGRRHRRKRALRHARRDRRHA